MLKRLLYTLFLFTCISSTSHAADLRSPQGLWKTISDKTNQPSSIVKISGYKGTLIGKIEQLLPGSHFKAGDLCSKCPDSLKNKPIIGLVFLWGFVASGNDSWKDGKLLDPNEGKIYRGTLKLIDHGQKMELRGYWGPFWRTQTWIRVG